MVAAPSGGIAGMGFPGTIPQAWNALTGRAVRGRSIRLGANVSSGEMALLLSKITGRLGLEKCHYCHEKVREVGSAGAIDRPDLVATRDHILPKCEGGRDWVLACSMCNQIKGHDPYRLFSVFMNNIGRRARRHERKNKYKAFRNTIITMGLDAFHKENVRAEEEIPIAVSDRY